MEVGSLAFILVSIKVILARPQVSEFFPGKGFAEEKGLSGLVRADEW